MTMRRQPTTALPSSATRAERASLRQRCQLPDESRRCELGIVIETCPRQGLRSMSRRVGVVPHAKSS